MYVWRLSLGAVVTIMQSAPAKDGKNEDKNLPTFMR